MSRLSVSIVSGLVLLLASLGGAFAATSPEVVPAEAAVGDEVTFLNGCYLVVDDPPSEVQVALTQGDEQPDDESAEKTQGTLLHGDVGPYTYSFVVPDVQPGDYWVSLECAPGDWRTNLSEPGGAALLTVCEGECVEGGLDIRVFKFIDADGNLDTFDDQESAQGWEFGLDLTDGTIEDASPRTNVHGFAHWKFSAGSEGTTARVVELPHEGFELVGASCIKALNAFAEPVELAFELDGDSVTFQVDDPDLPYVECALVSTPHPLRAMLVATRPRHRATRSRRPIAPDPPVRRPRPAGAWCSSSSRASWPPPLSASLPSERAEPPPADARVAGMTDLLRPRADRSG